MMLDQQAQQEVADYIRNKEIEMQQLEEDKMGLAKAANSVFQTPENENIIQWQLDLQEQLDNVGHSLRGHVIGTNEEGGAIWVEPEKKEDVIFTEYGVQEILRFLLQYLNKNTILSNYNEEIINIKVYDAGYELNDLIFTRYEKFFYTTPREEIFEMIPELKKQPQNMRDRVIAVIQREEIREKYKHYSSAIRPIIDAIHSAYLRALNGGERESLRSARILTQSENPAIGKQMQMPMMQQQKKFSMFKPTTWF